MSEPLFTFIHVTDTHWSEGSHADAMLRAFPAAR